MAWVLVFLCTQCTFLDFLVSFPTSSPCYGWLLLPSVSSHCMSHVPFLLFPPLLCVLSDLCFTCPVKFPAPVITRLCSNVLHQRIIVSPRLFWIEAPVSSLPFCFFFLFLPDHFVPCAHSLLFPESFCSFPSWSLWFGMNDHSLCLDLLFFTVWFRFRCRCLTVCWPHRLTVFNLLSPSRSLRCRASSSPFMNYKYVASDAAL